MSKTKLALLVFCVAFGVNILAFVFSKKTFTVDEVKNVWLYELPPTSSPLDAYPSIDLGPHHAIIGTFFKPKYLTEYLNGASEANTPIELLLAKTWTWDERTRTIAIELLEGLTYSDESPILASHWVQSLEWAKSKMGAGETNAALSPEWSLFTKMSALAVDDRHLQLTFGSLPSGFDLPKFLSQVLTHPLAGVIHPENLATLKSGAVITKKWISSGPYKVRKWNPKEIVLVSRNNFPVMLPKEFFRQLKYQSAPVKNPSCDFIQAQKGEEPSTKEHSIVPVQEELRVYWICRSWNEPNSFCSDAKNRLEFSKMKTGSAAQSWSGKKVRYRIPQGSDAFREEFRSMIREYVAKSGGVAEEISYFFKASKEADIELEFVVTPLGTSDALAETFARFSTRLAGGTGPNLVGELRKFPIDIQMKKMKGDVYQKVFLEPDVDAKMLGL